MQWLKYYREKSGLSMSRLSEMENEKASPSVEIAKTLAKIFGITESELLNGPIEKNWELRLVMRKAGDPQKGVMDMTTSESNAALYIEDNKMAVMLSADYTLWEDDAKFEELIEQLRRKRVLGLKSRHEDW